MKTRRKSAVGANDNRHEAVGAANHGGTPLLLISLFFVTAVLCINIMLDSRHSTANHSSNTIEKERKMPSPVVAVNVCIVPPEPVTKAIKELAANVCQARPAKPDGNGDAFGACFYQAGGEEGHVVPSHPHVTLLQCYVKPEHLADFSKAVEHTVAEYLKKAGTLKIPFRRELDPGPVFGQLDVDAGHINVHMPAVAVTSSGFQYNQEAHVPTADSATVEELHELLVKFAETSPLVERDTVSFEQDVSTTETPFAKDALVESFVQKPANDASAKWAAIFATKLSREKYFPHITIGTALSTAVLPAPPPYEGPSGFDVEIGADQSSLPDEKFGKIVVSQMGNFCSCSNVIAVV